MTTKLIKVTILIVLIAGFNVYGQERPEVHIGGALRFNYNYSSWKEGQKERGGDFGYDLFRINAKAKYGQLSLNAEYRLYSDYFGGGMLKQGWVAYDFNENNNLQIGLTQVPFGLTTYNSNNWFFSINYYVGLEDDHDMGIKYTHIKNNWEMNLAFFKNAEELMFESGSDINPNRYSYDISSITEDGNSIYRNKEVNQLNYKIAYNIGEGNHTQQIGASAEYGGLYNLDTEKTGNHYALAGHYRLNANKLGIKAAVSYYKYNPKHPDGQDDKLVAMAAYGAPYLVAAEGISYTLGVSYTVPVDWNPISSLVFYNDFGMIDKTEKSFEDSFMNVTGVMITSGQVYTYIDHAMGKNQPWIGPDWTDALGAGNPDAEWETRFNINIGYYF